MSTVYKVPENYSWAAAYAAAAADDIILLNTTISGITLLTKPVHIVGYNVLEGSLPTSGFISSGNLNYNGTYHYSPVVVNIPSNSWAANQSTLYFESLVFDMTYVGDWMSTINWYGSMPEGCSVIFNKCVFRNRYDYYKTAAGVSLLNTPKVNFSFINCWFTTAYANTGAYPAVWPSISAANTGSAFLTQKCIVPTTASNGAAYLPYYQDIDNITNAANIGTTYGPKYGTPRFGNVITGNNYTLNGVVTDIPEYIPKSQFKVYLYAEASPNSNDFIVVPYQWKTLAEDGTWSFDWLPLDRRYGVLINPPDGMQGHWLRWYNPATILE